MLPDGYADGLDFGWALANLHRGYRLQRTGWNSLKQWIILVNENQWTVDYRPESVSEQFTTRPFILMKTVQGTLVPWLASQTDILATDWAIVE